MGEYTVITFRGHLFDRRSKAIYLTVEQEMGYKRGTMDCMQGMYNVGGVEASAGTHDRGGAWDCSFNDAFEKSRRFRDHGCPSWPRPELIINGVRVWGPHDHTIDAFNKRLQSPVATGQVTKYNNHQDGLSGSNPDNMKYHPDLKPFDYDAYIRRLNRVRRLYEALTDAVKDSRERSATRRNRIQKLRKRQLAAAKRRERLRRRIRNLPDVPNVFTDQ